MTCGIMIFICLGVYNSCRIEYRLSCVESCLFCHDFGHNIYQKRNIALSLQSSALMLLLFNVVTVVTAQKSICFFIAQCLFLYETYCIMVFRRGIADLIPCTRKPLFSICITSFSVNYYHLSRQKSRQIAGTILAGIMGMVCSQ